MKSLSLLAIMIIAAAGRVVAANAAPELKQADLLVACRTLALVADHRAAAGDINDVAVLKKGFEVVAAQVTDRESIRAYADYFAQLAKENQNAFPAVVLVPPQANPRSPQFLIKKPGGWTHIPSSTSFLKDVGAFKAQGR